MKLKDMPSLEQVNQIMELLTGATFAPYDIGRALLLDMKIVFDTIEAGLSMGTIKQVRPGEFTSVLD